MPSVNPLTEVARTLVDAFDVDIQLWMGRTLESVRETPSGASFADWAEANPVVFETLLRVTSALVQRLPKDDNLLIETVSSQLARLPVEVRRAVKGNVPNSRDMAIDNDEFYRKYEKAVEDLSDEELATVVRLDRHRLREWVNSPARVRSHLLAKWAEQDSAGREMAERRNKDVSELVAQVPKQAKEVGDALAPKIGKLADWLERHGGRR